MRTITKSFLKDYKLIQEHIHALERRKRYFDNHPLLQSQGIVKGSMREFPYAECRFFVGASEINVKAAEERRVQVNQLILDIEANKQMYEDMKLDIEEFLYDTRFTIEEQLIIRLYYVEGMKMKKIGEKLNYSISAISKKIDAIIDKCED